MLKSLFIVLSLLCSSNIFAGKEEKVPLLHKQPESVRMENIQIQAQDLPAWDGQPTFKQVCYKEFCGTTRNRISSCIAGSAFLAVGSALVCLCSATCGH